MDFQLWAFGLEGVDKTLSELGRSSGEEEEGPGKMRGLAETAMGEEKIKEEKNGKTIDEGKRDRVRRSGDGELGRLVTLATSG